MADPVWVDGVTPLNAVNMTKLQTRDEKNQPSGYVGMDGASGASIPGSLTVTNTLSVGPDGTQIARDAIELYGRSGQVVAFMDFHYYTGSAQDYNVRLANDADGQLSTTASAFKLNSGNLVIGGGYAYFGSALDTNLYRLSAGYLATDSQFYMRGSSPYFVIQPTGNSQAVFFIDPSGYLKWGSGSATQDVNLYRYSAGFLKTDMSFVAGRAIYVDASGGGYSLYFGAAADASIYRPAANQLLTPGSFVADYYDARSSNSGGVAYYATQLHATGTIIISHQAGDTQWRYQVDANGKTWWGPGGTTAVDTNLYRSTTTVPAVQTDGGFIAGNDIVARTGTAQVKIGQVSSNAGLAFGVAADCLLYRVGNGVLKTDTTLLFTSPAARVYHNANQSIGNAVTTATLAFNSERFDTDTIHDTATNNSRLTCKTAGVYMISACFQWDASAATATSLITLRVNGSTEIARSRKSGNIGNIEMSLTTLYQLAVNDYVEVLAYQNSGAALNVMAAGNFSPEFSMVKVG